MPRLEGFSLTLQHSHLAQQQADPGKKNQLCPAHT